MGSVLSVAHVLGRMLMVFSLMYLMPIVCALVYADGTLLNFLDGMLGCLGAGAMLYLLTFRHRADLKARDGFILVAMAWTLVAGIATEPLILHQGMTFTDAMFETMSGLTTTGATVMTGLDSTAPAINLWRCELNWLGGMGIIVLAVAILPMLGVGGMQLLKAEVPGPIKDTKLTARIADTATALWAVYIGATLACILSLRLVGMSWFDAICHAFAALSLGGFSTHDASVGAFDSPAIEAVLILFMILAALNFATHFTVLKERSPKPYWRDAEATTVLALIAISSVGCGIYLWRHNVYPDVWASLRYASFNLVSIATDCGFASADFGAWPIFVPFWMLFLSCITVSSGSTGGGIKMIRTLVLAHQSSRELSRLIHPTLVSPLTIAGAPIPNNVVFAVLGFSFLYAMSVVVLTFLLIFGGLDFISALSAVVACINNAGPGLGQVGPAQNYASLNDFETWVCTFTMLLGRLEVFSVLILFTPQFWRN
ncbi:MAG: potassium transporter TrkG [Chromatiaceae bacterium]